MVHLYSSRDSEHQVIVERRFTRRNRILRDRMKRAEVNVSSAIEDIEDTKDTLEILLQRYRQTFSLMIAVMKSLSQNPWIDQSISTITEMGEQIDECLESVSSASDSLDRFMTEFRSFNEGIGRDPRFHE